MTQANVNLSDFAREVASLLALPDDVDVREGASLYDDWGVDSLQAFQMIVIVESMAGVLVPPEHIPELFTVGDAYGYFCTLRAAEQLAR